MIITFINLSLEKEFDNEKLVEKKVNQAVERRYQEIKELETLSKQTKGLNSKLDQMNSVRKNTLDLGDKKPKQSNSPNLNRNSPNLNPKLRHKSEKSGTSQKKGNQGQKRGQKSKSIGSKKEIKDDDKDSLDKAKSILMNEFQRKHKQREKINILKRTNNKMDALNRFKKFSRPFLNPDQADPNEELKNRVQKKDMEKEKEERAERQRKILESVKEEFSDDSEDEKESKNANELWEEEIVKEKEEVIETKKVEELNDKENNVPVQRKIKIEKKVSSSDSKTSAAEENAKKYLQMLEEKKKSQKAPVQKMKFDVAAYSRVNNPDSKQSLEDQKRLQSLISETASFSQIMETV